MAPKIKPQSVSELKSKMMRPSLSSYFAVEIPFPTDETLRKELQSILGANQESLNLMCAEASLPGSRLATYEVNNDRTGVTERHAYRRLFDDRIDLTFYVDGESYIAIRFFEIWMRRIANENVNESFIRGGQYNYRMKYPDKYVAENGLNVYKFERDYKSYLQYEFIRSYPFNMNSMPVSYDGNDLLRCTVSMTYIRYLMFGPAENDFEYTPTAERFFERNRDSIINDRGGSDFEFDLSRFGLNRRIIQDPNQGLT